MTDLAAALLRALHKLAVLPLCPGDWLSTTALAGAVCGLLPVAAAIVVSLVRKGTGNQYSAPVVVVFGAVGVLGAAVLPWAGFRAIGQVLRSGELELTTHSCFVGNQVDYFIAHRTVWSALTNASGQGRLVQLLYVALLVAVPLAGLIFVALLAKAAFRRGPGWPARVFFWLPHLALIVGSFVLPANTTVSLWLGYVPVPLVGALLVLLLGPPPWSVIHRSAREPAAARRPEPAPEPLAPAPGPVPAPVAPPVEQETVATGSRFRRIRTLGTGGFGTVWLAMDTHLGRTVAVKFAHAPDAETEERMMREARALAVVGHPNCVRIYDVVTEPDGLGLVMEYIAGASLSDTVRGNGALDDVSAARLWATLAGALDDAHQHGVLHRDVKPSNVIVDPDGVPHLIDFGIARSTGDATLTQSGMMMGTPDFLAPETAAGHGATPSSDAWQLAATVSYGLTGRSPRGSRETPMAALMAAARAEEPSELPAHSAHIELLREVLQADPAQRPTLASVRAVLIDWLAERGYDEEGPVSTVVTEPVRRTHP